MKDHNMTNVVELVNMLTGTISSRQGAKAAITAADDEEARAHLESAIAAADEAEAAIIARLGETPLRSRDDLIAVTAVVALLVETGAWPSHAALLAARIAEAVLALSAPSNVAA